MQNRTGNTEQDKRTHTFNKKHYNRSSTTKKKTKRHRIAETRNSRKNSPVPPPPGITYPVEQTANPTNSGRHRSACIWFNLRVSLKNSWKGGGGGKCREGCKWSVRDMYKKKREQKTGRGTKFLQKEEIRWFWVILVLQLSLDLLGIGLYCSCA